jgi:DNA-binding NarL/FixJ family response regulator
MSGIRIVVVSDRRLSGLALAHVISTAPGTLVVAEVNDVAAAKGCCERGEADAVLMDASVLLRRDSDVPPDSRQDQPFDAKVLGTLTPREREVLALLGAGLSNTRISAKLGVSEATVKSHVGRVLAKLNLESRLQAGLAALRDQ